MALFYILYNDSCPDSLSMSTKRQRTKIIKYQLISYFFYFSIARKRGTAKRKEFLWKYSYSSPRRSGRSRLVRS